tara:strand:+ start:458 stop:703 length:246 start_codon:yes stop_codon:yes gene_type:complete
MFDIYITREISKEVVDKSIKVIEDIELEKLNNTIEKFNEDLGKPKVLDGYFIWENNNHKVEVLIIDSATKTKVNCEEYVTQ